MTEIKCDHCSKPIATADGFWVKFGGIYHTCCVDEPRNPKKKLKKGKRLPPGS